MKKILLIFIAFMAIVACSSDDNNKELEIETLILKSNKKIVDQGDSIEFSVNSDKQINIEDVTLVCNNKVIKSPYVFDQAGKFVVIAKKKGYNDSNSIEITVNESGIPNLVLTVNRQTFDIGDKVTFTIKDHKGNQVNNAKIFNETTKEELQGDTYEANDLGVFTFITKAEGYNDSSAISFEVKSVFSINNYKYSIDYFLISVEVEDIKDTNGKNKIVDKVFFLDDGTPCNLYAYYIVGKSGDQLDMLVLDILVPNHTIKSKDGVVTDYGQRILPSEVNKLKLNGVVAMTGDVYFGEFDFGDGISNLGDYDLTINEFTIANKGIGSGENGINGTGDLFIDYKSAENNFKVKYKGNLLLSEFVDEENKEDKKNLNFIKNRLKNKLW